MGRATVIGAGSWGTALAKVLAERGHAVRMWSYDAPVIDQIHGERENRDYLPGIKLPNTLEVFADH